MKLFLELISVEESFNPYEIMYLSTLLLNTERWNGQQFFYKMIVICSFSLQKKLQKFLVFFYFKIFLRRLIISNVTIHPSDKAKYSSVTIDKRLTFRKQIISIDGKNAEVSIIPF